MNEQVIAQREKRELKELLQDAVALATRHKSNMGLTDQEELSRITTLSNGGTHNPKNWDMSDKNGEQ